MAYSHHLEFLGNVVLPCLCFLVSEILDLFDLCHGSFIFSGALQRRIDARFSRTSFKLTSVISKEENNVGYINWHISAWTVFE